MNLPKSVRALTEAFERLPGIGPKTAARLTYYLLQAPLTETQRFAQSLLALKSETKICSICKNIDDVEPCSICTDANRDSSLICVIEKPLDLIALEKSGKYRGLYHILGGSISPLNNIGPDEIYVGELVKRLTSSVEPASSVGGRPTIKEVILATNANLEGETTSMYLAKLIKQIAPAVKVTRIGRGLPVGSDIEYADEVTLERAMEGRNEYL